MQKEKVILNYGDEDLPFILDDDVEDFNGCLDKTMEIDKDVIEDALSDTMIIEGE